MASPQKRARVEHIPRGLTCSVTTAWSLAYFDDGAISGFDTYTRAGGIAAFLYKGRTVPLASIAYNPGLGSGTLDGKLPWNMHAMFNHPWTTVLDAPFPVRAITVKGWVHGHYWHISTTPATANLMSINNARQCGAQIGISSPAWPAIQSAFPLIHIPEVMTTALVRIIGLPETPSSGSRFFHGRTDGGFISERTIFDQPQEFAQRQVTLELYEAISEGKFQPYTVGRRITGTGAAIINMYGGMAPEYNWVVTITLHAEVPSEKDADGWLE